ncbi:proliferation marker protein Ki-67 [Artibeus jamaicensis]|uniref:proliferation marker protein Ki-67 n=1 Tax=Artibeus jamaicensis TaxID=9417 RepID=UPI00235A6CF3|nr:proliferation marker protein Ki-67 [Artibeus jamaicensis]XP_053524499.1 proliferation marker protein Ki-67 [Artibeus jamaicensis]
MGPAGRLVTIKRSGGDGAHFPLSLSTCLFGRGVECDIRIQLPVVSRQHCKIEVQGQKAVLFNFSAANPTQVNGSAIDGPVQLKHGDVITVIDRSFRYEDGRHQSGSTSAEFPGQRRGQASPRRVSRSSFSSNPDGEVEGHGAACPQFTEEGVSEEPLVLTEGVRVARAISRSSGGPAPRTPADGHCSEPLGDDRRNTAGPPAGSPGEGSRGTLVSRNGEPEAVPSPWCLERGGEKESPFRKLYESMKEKLDEKSEKENVLQHRRKSGSRGHCAADSESVGGSWGGTALQGSPKSWRRSWRGSQTKAVPAPEQREEERAGEGPGPTAEATASPSVSPTETIRGNTPVPCSHRNSSRKRRSGGGSCVHAGEPVNPEQTAACTPKKLFSEHGTPTRGESADDFGDTPEKVFSRKRRNSLPPKVDIRATETEIPKPAVLTPLRVHVERKVPGGSLGPPWPLGAAAGCPGLSSTDVSDWEESPHEMEGVPLKTRRVSFGGRLRPELFDENLPPNTPLKRGETPMRRRSLVTHAPAVLKKIIKGQPQESGKEGSSEVRLEVTTQNVCVSSPAFHPTKSSSVANDSRRRSSKPPASSGSQSPPQTEVPKRGGRRSSSGAPSQRAPSDRGQHGLLQMIRARRRSGASEANLIVAKSWADIVKLSAKQTQAKAVKHGPPRQPSRRRRRANTPKKPTGCAYNEFSTGHANSPCTIVIGKAHLERVTAPARPYRMLNSSMLNRKIDFSEDLSGLTEMFKTPAKEKPKKMSLRLTAFSNSEGLFRKQFQVPESEEKPLLCTPAKFGENVFPSAQSAPEEPSDKKSASPALRKEYMTGNKNMLTPPSETEPSRTASRVKKSRRSVGLRNTQGSGTGCEKEDPEFDTVESILGRCLRKSPAQEQLLEGEMKESERAFATCKRNFESKENSEKRILRRSRRSSDLKCAQRTDVIATKTLQESESKEGLVGIPCFLQTPGYAEAPVGMENKATMRCCRSPKPEPVSTLSEMNVEIKTPSQSVSAEALSVRRKPTQTPGDTKHTHKEPVGGDESMKASKTFPEQQQDSADHVIGSRSRPRTPKKKAQPIEDLAGFKELFQTPKHTVETVTDDKTMKIPSKSPKAEPVSRPSSTKRHLRTPLGKVDVEEELSALEESTPTPGETTHSPGEPVGDDEDIRALKGTPEQKQHSAQHVSGSRRRSRTPKRKAEHIEDLMGLKDLFQTPNHIVEPVTEDKTKKTSSKAPKLEPVSTPSKINVWIKTPSQSVSTEVISVLRKSTQTPGDTKHTHKEQIDGLESMKSSNKFPEQQQDLAEHVTRSRRRSRTPKKKAQPIEDLAGFKELFQTPNHTDEPMTDDKTMKIPSKSPRPEPVSRPTSTKRHLRTPLERENLEEFSGLRKPTQTSGKITCSPRDPEGDAEDIRALKGTPEQKQDSAQHVSGSRRRSRTPMRTAEPTEDLTGLKELFQTPNHVVETVTNDKTTKVPSKSPKPEPVSTLTGTKRRLRTPLGKMDVDEELSTLGEFTPTPGETTHSSGEPVGDDEDIRALKGTPDQKQGSAEHVTGSRRRSRTPKRKVEPTEDLTGFKELFQTPNNTVEPMTEDKIIKTPSKSPKPEPVSTKRCLRTTLGKVELEEEFSGPRTLTQTSGETVHSPEPEDDDEDIRALKGTPEQKWHSAEHVSGSRRRSRTTTRKVEPTEDLIGFKELFQTPNRVMETVTNDKTTKVPSRSLKPEPVSTPTSTKRRLRTPLGKTDLEEELPALREFIPTPGETTHSPGEPVVDDEDIRALKGTPEQKQGSAEHVSGSRRRSRTAKKKVQPTEDLAGFKQLFQTPNHTDEPMTEDKTMKIPSKSPKRESVSTPTSTKRHLRTPLGKVDLDEEFSGSRKPTQASGETTHSPGDSEGDDEDIRALKGTPEQKQHSAQHVSGSRRRSRTAKRKVEPTEDLTGLKELFQTPNHVVETVTNDKTTKVPSKSPKPEPVSTLTSTKRRLRTPLGKTDVEGELLTLRESTPTPGETIYSLGEPEDDAEDTRALKGTPEQKLDSAEHVTRRGRRSTPKRKVEPTEDLTGFKELFQTPSHIVEPVTENKIMKIPSKSPKPEPVSTLTNTKRRLRTPLGKMDVDEELSTLGESTPIPGETIHSPGEPEGDDEAIRALKGTPEQKQDSAQHVSGSGRRSKTAKRVNQPIEDLVGFKELFQTPRHTVESMIEDKATNMPCKSAQAKPAVMPTGRNRRLKAPPGKVVMKDELSVLQSSTRISRKITRSHREPEGGDNDMKLFKESPEQKLLPAENVTASKRRLRTRKEKAQVLADPGSLKELLQVPNHTEDPVAVATSTEMPSGSSQAEAVIMPARTRRQLKAPPEMVAVQEESLALRRPRGTSGKTTRSHREPEGADKDTKLFKESPEQKLLPAENVTASKRRPRTCKEKAQVLADPGSLKELLQVPNHTEDPVAVATSTEMPSGSPQAEAVIMPARTRRQLKVPPGTVAVQGRATRLHREHVDGAKDIEVCKGPPRPELGPVGNAVGSGRLLRSRKGKAQPPHSPANSKQLLQSPAQNKELGTDTASVTRPSTQTPDQSKPVTTSRRALRALNMKPIEELVDSRDPVKSQSETNATQSPKRKREDGSCAGLGRLRPRTRTQDTAEGQPPRKRQRTTPREQCTPLEPSEPKKGRRVLRDGIEPVDDLPSANRKTKNKGRKEDATSPNKGVSLCSSLPNKTKAAGQRHELISPGKVQRKRNEKKPVKSSPEVEIQNLEGGAQNSAPGVKVHERRTPPRPGRRGKVPAPCGAEEKALASSVETHRKARGEKGGAPRSGFICLRSRKVTVPPTGDTSESQSEQRVMRSAKRPVEDAGKASGLLFAFHSKQGMFPGAFAPCCRSRRNTLHTVPGSQLGSGVSAHAFVFVAAPGDMCPGFPLQQQTRYGGAGQEPLGR